MRPLIERLTRASTAIGIGVGPRSKVFNDRPESGRSEKVLTMTGVKGSMLPDGSYAVQFPPDRQIEIGGVKLSRREVAHRTGMSHRYIQRIFLGQRVPRLTNAKKLADAFEVTIDHIYAVLAKVERPDERFKTAPTQDPNAIKTQFGRERDPRMGDNYRPPKRPFSYAKWTWHNDPARGTRKLVRRVKKGVAPVRVSQKVDTDKPIVL